MRVDQRLELADHLRVAAERELGLDQLLVRSHPLVLQARDLALGERLVGEVVERRAAPERERRVQRRDRPLGAARGELAPPLRQPALEPVRVELLGLDPQLVAVLARDHHVARASALRSRETLTWSVFAAPGGRGSPHSSSISRSLLSASFAWSRRSARSARWRFPPSATGRPPSEASSGPRMRKSMGARVAAGGRLNVQESAGVSELQPG